LKNILFFGDFGIDDMVALLYGYYSDEINIVGIVAEYGNVPKEDAVRNALFFQELTGTNVPIISGADLPLTGKSPTFYPDIHGIEGLGPIVPNVEISDVFENFFEVVNIIEQYGSELIIVNTGRLSSLSTMLILYPDLIQNVKNIYIMGGAFFVPGNVTPVAEANIYGDPYAANLVLNDRLSPVHIIPLNVTKDAILTPDMVNELHSYFVRVNDPVGKYIKTMVDYYYNFYKENDPTIIGSPLHDLLTLWAVTDESEIHYESVPVKVVVQEGDAFGQTIGDFRKTKEKESYPIHKVAVSFDYQRYIQQIFQTFMSKS
jgi:purine nucleosidase